MDNVQTGSTGGGGGGLSSSSSVEYSSNIPSLKCRILLGFRFDGTSVSNGTLVKSVWTGYK